MGLRRRGNGHRTQGLVLQDFQVGAEHPAIGVLLFEGSELIFVAVADRGKRVEVMKVPHEVLTPVSRTDTRDRFYFWHLGLLQHLVRVIWRSHLEIIYMGDHELELSVSRSPNTNLASYRHGQRQGKIVSIRCKPGIAPLGTN